MPTLKIKLPPPPKPKRSLLNILTGLTKNLPQVEEAVFKIPEVPDLVLPELDTEIEDDKNDIIADHVILSDALELLAKKAEKNVSEEIQKSSNDVGSTIVSTILKDIIEDVVTKVEASDKPKILKPITLKVHNVLSGIKKTKKPKFKVIRVSATQQQRKIKRAG